MHGIFDGFLTTTNQIFKISGCISKLLCTKYGTFMRQCSASKVVLVVEVLTQC